MIKNIKVTVEQYTYDIYSIIIILSLLICLVISAITL